MFTLVKELQSWNAPLPIEVTELGMSIEIKLWQYKNAYSPIDVTELPMATLVKP